MGTEKRKAERVRTEYEVRITVAAQEGETQEGTCLNLSEGGLFLQVERRLPPGTVIQLVLDLDPIGKTLDARGRTVWAWPDLGHSPFPPGVGVRLTHLRRAARRKIQETIEQQKRLHRKADSGDRGERTPGES